MNGLSLFSYDLNLSYLNTLVITISNIRIDKLYEYKTSIKILLLPNLSMCFVSRNIQAFEILLCG